MKEDRYRLTAFLFKGNLNYNLYGIGAKSGNGAVKLPLKQDGAVFFGEILRRVKWKFFVGVRILTGNSIITARSAPSVSVQVPPNLATHQINLSWSEPETR